MSDDLARLLNYLEVDQIDKYLFIGQSPAKPARIFGGQVLSQSINAAMRTVEDTERAPHSMHAYFLRPGDPTKQIVYEVDPIRDGRSFNTRRVVAKQDGAAIFSTSVSFHVFEEGLEHYIDMPDVPPPEEVQTDLEYFSELEKQYPGKFDFPKHWAIERRSINRRDRVDPKPQEPIQHMWFKVQGDLGQNHILHQTLLAYISDFALLGAPLLPHPYHGHSKGMQAASLDHALWFHRPFRADEYLLYTMDGPSASGSRGFGRGSFYTQEGLLVASVAQESLIRLKDS